MDILEKNERQMWRQETQVVDSPAGTLYTKEYLQIIQQCGCCDRDGCLDRDEGWISGSISVTLTGIRQEDRCTERKATLAHNGMKDGSPIPDWDQERAMDLGS